MILAVYFDIEGDCVYDSEGKFFMYTKSIREGELKETDYYSGKYELPYGDWGARLCEATKKGEIEKMNKQGYIDCHDQTYGYKVLNLFGKLTNLACKWPTKEYFYPDARKQDQT